MVGDTFGQVCVEWVTVWEVTNISDNGIDRSITCYATREAAENAAKGASEWGSNGRIQERYALRIIGSGEYHVIDASIKVYTGADDRDRKAAIAKLSPRERALLGIR